MNSQDFKELISKIRKVALEKFKELAAYTNTDEGHFMVQFCSKTIHSRKINDLGRDEDTDRFIGIDKTGWVEYVHKIAHGVGPVEISNPQVNQLDDDDIISFLTGENCGISEYLEFMETCIKIKNKYSITF